MNARPPPRQKPPRQQPVRIALWLASAALALPPAAMLAAPLSASTGEGQFRPPQARMLLTRVLHSPLADGKEIVASRTFEIEIRAVADGYRVDGRQVACTVDAPPSLGALAEIERNRVEDGLFPMMLDSRGMIRPPATRPPSPAMAGAAPIALDMLRRSGMPPQDTARAVAFVRRLEAQPATSNWPNDLFRPVPGRRLDDRAIVTADGLSGHLQVEIDARTAQDSGMLAALQRTITTELGGSRRTTREEWRLTVDE